jgi:YgiT-type zinc finger domain-containing protein
MTCGFCGEKTIPRKVRKQHWFQGRLYLVENVDAEVCLGCGERYYHATVLDGLDRHLGAEHEVKETLTVEVVTL